MPLRLAAASIWKGSLVVLVAASCVLSGPLGFVAQARAAGVADLQKQKDALQKQEQQAEVNASRQEQLANRASERLDQVAGQITDLQSSIFSTKQSISETQSKVADKGQEAASLQSQLGAATEQRDALIRQLYITMVSHPDDLEIFADETVSQKEVERDQLATLMDAVASTAKSVQAKHAVVATALDELNGRQRELEGLRQQQDEQVAGLASVKQQQSALKNDAKAAQQQYEAQADAARAKVNKIEDQISAELAALVKAKSSGQPISGGQGVGLRVAKGTVVGHEGSTGNSTGPHVHFECRSGSSTVDCQPYVNKGTLAYPIGAFKITQTFGETANSYLYKGSPHTGMDLAGPYGSPVTAPADGTVILNKWYGGYGNAWAMQLDSGLVVLLGHMTGN